MLESSSRGRIGKIIGRNIDGLEKKGNKVVELKTFQEK